MSEYKEQFDAEIEQLKSDLADIKSALQEKEVVVTGDLKLTQVPDYIDKIGG